MSSDEESINNDKDISEIDEQNIVEEIGGDLQQDQENGNTEEVLRDETAEGDGEGNKDEEKEVVKPKRVIRNPQPKLNAETLKGPRGIAALPSYFERVKFKGKGYERQDLNAVMKTYEYWCHRLFPKFPFDTCIERLDKLGHKRAVQTHIKRIRYDLLINEDKPIIDSSDEENNVEGFVDTQSNKINQQFDSLLPSSNTEQRGELTEEQLERIKLNKDRAERLREERLKKIQERAEASLEIPSQLPGTSGLDNEITVEQIDSQSTQSDIISETVHNNTSEEHAFDMESNIKGKSNFKGNLVKKKSSQQVTINSIESDEDDSAALQKYDKHDETIEDSIKRNLNNIIDSDDSGNEFVESSKDIRHRKRVANILDSDQSDEECDTMKSDFVNGSDKSSDKNSMDFEKSAVMVDSEELMEIDPQTETLVSKSHNLTCTNPENKENSSVDNIIS